MKQLIRILLADDDGPIRRIISWGLRREGYQVETAEDGADAWVALKDREFDLLVTDNHMPKMSGIQLLRLIRTARMVIPVVMITGYFSPDQFGRDPALLPTAVLQKPFEITELLATIRSIEDSISEGRPKTALPQF